MKAIKTSHTKDISDISLDLMSKTIDQVSENDIKDVKKDVFWIFRGMKR
jgi:hypothetical protein